MPRGVKVDAEPLGIDIFDELEQHNGFFRTRFDCENRSAGSGIFRSVSDGFEHDRIDRIGFVRRHYADVRGDHLRAEFDRDIHHPFMELGPVLPFIRDAEMRMRNIAAHG